MTHTETPTAQQHAHLYALMQRLDLYDLDVKITPEGLAVSDPDGDGCCEDNPEPSALVTCVYRPSDNDRLWFRYASWGEWIIEADNPVDAAGMVASRLRGAG
ncbi:hypothetical protein [Actinomadura meyerae]|nr:hypothetical protein [Actinomadura meyerae]